MKKIIIGSLVIATGVMVLLSNIDVYGVRELVSVWWPLTLVVVGLLIWWGDSRNYIWPLVFVTVGVMLQLDKLEIVEADFGDLILPLILVAIGISLMLSSRAKPSSQASDDSIVAVLGGIERVNTSDDYRGGSVTAIMGGAMLDLSQATIKKHATINTTIVMGGLELKVPSNAIVKNNSIVIMGGVEDGKAPVAAKSAPTIYIEGSTVMGGIEVKR